MIDKTTIIVTYGAELDKVELLRYGTITNDLPRMAVLFLRVTDDVLARVGGLRGVVRAAWNEIHTADEIMHSVSSPLTAAENWKIYEEINLAAAHAITTGDPRVRIATIDSGFSSDHPDINCVGGGRFVDGVYHADNALPMKVNISEMAAGMGIGILMGASIYAHDVNRAKTSSRIPSVGYTDSTCKTPLFIGSVPVNCLAGAAFWINQPVDVALSDEDLDYWQNGVGSSVMYDMFGHGTAVAGIIGDIAPGCTNVVFKLTNDMGNLNTVDILACADYIAQNDFHIASTSWGGPTSPDRDLAYATILASGALWSCSAGNDGAKPDTDVATDAYLYPGATPGVFCVGACGAQTAENTDTGYIDYHPDYIDYSRITYYSQKHDRVQIVAPGFGWQVHAPLNYNYAAGQTIHFNEFLKNWNMRRYTSQRTGGTSWAQPAVAASAGLMMSKIISGYQTTDPAEVTAILRAAVTPVKNTLKATAKGPMKLSNGNSATVGYGAGRLDVGAAVAAI